MNYPLFFDNKTKNKARNQYCVSKNQLACFSRSPDEDLRLCFFNARPCSNMILRKKNLRKQECLHAAASASTYIGTYISMQLPSLFEVLAKGPICGFIAHIVFNRI